MGVEMLSFSLLPRKMAEDFVRLIFYQAQTFVERLWSRLNFADEPGFQGLSPSELLFEVMLPIPPR